MEVVAEVSCLCRSVPVVGQPRVTTSSEHVCMLQKLSRHHPLKDGGRSAFARALQDSLTGVDNYGYGFVPPHLTSLLKDSRVLTCLSGRELGSPLVTALVLSTPGNSSNSSSEPHRVADAGKTAVIVNS